MYKNLICLLLALAASFSACAPKVSEEASGKESEFAIYLLPDDVRHEQVSSLDLAALKPAGTPLITQKDVLAYGKDRHELIMSPESADRLNKLDLPGKTFAAFVDDKPVYAGAFWTSIWSSSFDGVYIDVHDLERNPAGITIGLGYPKNSRNLSDPRHDSRILDIFAKTGHLRQELFIRGKCKKIQGISAQVISITFNVLAVTRGEYKENDISIEVPIDDPDSKKILDALYIKRATEGQAWTYDPDTELLLMFNQPLPISSGQPRFSNFKFIE